MDAVHYDARKTALLFIDPYNDFLSEGGKVWPAIQAVAEEVHLLDNLRAIQSAARAAGRSPCSRRTRARCASR